MRRALHWKRQWAYSSWSVDPTRRACFKQVRADASKTPLVPLSPKSDLIWNTSRPTDARGPVGRRSDLRRRQYRWRVRINIRRSAMSDAALSEHRAAALESSAHSNAMKPAASKTGRDRRADVWSSDAGAMETSGPTKAMKTPAASKTGRDRRADVWSSGAVKLMKIPAAKAAVEAAAGKTRGDGRGAGVETGRR